MDQEIPMVRMCVVQVYANENLLQCTTSWSIASCKLLALVKASQICMKKGDEWISRASLRHYICAVWVSPGSADRYGENIPNRRDVLEL